MSANKKIFLISIVALWFLISSIGSAVKGDGYKCDRTYPVDYIFFTEAFCEIEELKERDNG
jgi:hypothetical protein